MRLLLKYTERIFS